MINLFYGNSVPEGRWAELKLEEGEEPLCGVLQIMPADRCLLGLHAHRTLSPLRTHLTAYTPHCICW